MGLVLDSLHISDYIDKMTSDLIRNCCITLAGILAFIVVHGLLKGLLERLEEKKASQVEAVDSQRAYTQYVAELEERNQILEYQNDQQRHEIRRMIGKELEYLNERKITNNRLRLLAGEIRATDNTRKTKVFKAVDLQEKVAESSRTMNLDIDDLELE